MELEKIIMATRWNIENLEFMQIAHKNIDYLLDCRKNIAERIISINDGLDKDLLVSEYDLYNTKIKLLLGL